MIRSRPKAKPKAQPPTKPAGRVYGLSPKDYPRNLRDYVDQDYQAKLSPKELEWLAAFNERHYGADFRGDVNNEWSPELRRKAYRAKNAANRGDIYGVANAVGNLKFAGDKPLAPDPNETENVKDINPTPKYLNSIDYKEAVRTYRQAISDKAESLTLARLRRQVEVFTHEAPDQDPNRD